MTFAVSSSNFEASGGAIGEKPMEPALHRRSVTWLFGATGQQLSPYLIVSAIGLAGFVGLLILGSLFQDAATILHPAALAWFFVFGLFRIATFSRR